MSTDIDYYNSSEFQKNLHEYENAKKTGAPVFLDSDDLTDIAEYYDYLGDIENAMAVIELAICLYPDAIAPPLFKARIALNRESNVGKAEELCEMVEDISDLDYILTKAEIMIADNRVIPAYDFLYQQLGNLAEEEHDMYVAEVANLFVDYGLTGHVSSWLKEANNASLDVFDELKSRILISNREYDEAERYINKLIDKSPYNVTFWNYLSKVQYYNSRFEESLISSEYALAISPDNDEALANKGDALYALGRYCEAMSYYKKLSDFMPHEVNWIIEQIKCLTLLGRLDDAEEYARKAIQMSENPYNNPFIAYWLAGEIQGLKGNTENALLLFDKAVNNGGCQSLDDLYEVFGFFANGNKDTSCKFLESYTDTNHLINNNSIETGSYHVTDKDDDHEDSPDK